MNNGIFKKNIESICEEKIFLKEYLCQFQTKEEPEEKMDLNEYGAEEIAGKVVLFAISNQKVFQLGSLYDDDCLAEIWFEQIQEPCFNSKLLLFGLGNGMYIRKFLEKVPKTGGIIVYEPSKELFIHILKSIELTDLLSNPQIQIYVEGIEEVIAKDFLYRHISFSDIEGLIFHDYLNYKTLFPEQFVRFFHDCQMMINGVNATNVVWERFGEAYYQNTLRNLPYFLGSRSLVDLYERIPKDIPVILVASGPSLDRNIMQLHKAKGKVFLIAVDSSLKALLQHDIIPDLFVTVDGMKLNAHFTDPRVAMIPVVCNLSGIATVIENHRGVKFFVNDMNPHINHILNQRNKQIPIVMSGGSVANTAFSLVELLGFTRIIMVGQDLAYTDNKTHAAGTIRGAMNLDITQEECVEVEGYHGGMVRSSHEFLLYLDWFEKELELRPEITMINATEGGAKIRGAIQLSLQEAIEQECHQEIAIRQFIEQTGWFLNEEEYELVKKQLVESIVEMEQIQAYTEKAIRINYAMLNLVNTNKYSGREMEKLFQQSKELGEIIEKVPSMYYIECRIQNQINHLTKDIYTQVENEYEELKESVMKSLNYFQIIQKTMKGTRPDFEKRILSGIEKADELRKKK